MEEDEELVRALRLAGVGGLDLYAARLDANGGIPEVREDFKAEGHAALMFADAGFLVELRERPDVALSLGDALLHAEVKRFRRKAQDDLDDVRMRTGVVRYGDTLPTEGSAAWDQVANVARKKAMQLDPLSPNVLVILSSSSNCIEDGEVRTAANILDEELALDSTGPLGRLSALMLLTLSRGPRGRVYLFELRNTQVHLPRSVSAALAAIRDWRAS